jgi:hypothetical protein
MRIYNDFYLFLESVVPPTAVNNETGRDGSRILGCIEGGSGELVRDDLEGGSEEPGRDGGRRCWGETFLISIIIDIFSTILYINLFFKRNYKNC